MRTLMKIAMSALAALPLAGCLPTTPPEGVLACTSSAECPSGWVCSASRCWSHGDASIETDGGMPDAGPIDGAMPDAGPADAQPPTDAGPVVDCDPLDESACGAGERCAWVQLTIDSGETRCIPDGTVGAGGACTRGEPGETGVDDCQAGLACIQGSCVQVCDLTVGTSCGESGYCVRYSGLFERDETAIAGACQPACDPLERSTVAPPCPGGQGCYGYTLEAGSRFMFICAPAGTTAIGETISGTPFVNSCVPGSTAFRRADGTLSCTPYCQPTETYSGNASGEAGVSPYSCGELGGSATDACLFQWLFSGATDHDARLNEIGTCIPDGTLFYDDDMNPGTPDVEYPSCSTLPNTDTDGNGYPQHFEFGCAPLVP